MKQQEDNIKINIYKSVAAILSAYLLEGCRQVVIDTNNNVPLRLFFALVYLWGLTALIFSFFKS